MWLVALFKSNRFSRIQPPSHNLFTSFRHFKEPSEDLFLSLLLPEPFNDDTNGPVLHDKPKKDVASRIMSRMLKMWPNPPLSRQEFELSVKDLNVNTRDFSLKKTWQRLYPELRRLKCNWELSAYLLELETAAGRLIGDQSKTQ